MPSFHDYLRRVRQLRFRRRNRTSTPSIQENPQPDPLPENEESAIGEMEIPRAEEHPPQIDPLPENEELAIGQTEGPTTEDHPPQPTTLPAVEASEIGTRQSFFFRDALQLIRDLEASHNYIRERMILLDHTRGAGMRRLYEEARDRHIALGNRINQVLIEFDALAELRGQMGELRNRLGTLGHGPEIHPEPEPEPEPEPAPPPEPDRINVDGLAVGETITIRMYNLEPEAVVTTLRRMASELNREGEERRARDESQG